MDSRLLRRSGPVVLVAVLSAFVLSRMAGGVIDLDLFHEMALAREVLKTGCVPLSDSFAYTPTLDIVVHHEWGLGMITLFLAKIAGGTGIIALKFTLIYGLGWIVWTTARKRGASPVILSIFLVLAVVLSDFGFATVRAQMFSYVFAALLLAGFDLDRSGDRKWLVGVAVLFPVWANIHGGCLVGAALFGAHWLEQLLRRQPHWHLFFMGLALIPLAAINPWGFHFHRYLIYAITMPRPAIAEWSPLWNSENRMLLLNFAVSLLPIGLILKQTGFRGLPGILIIAATGMAAIKSNRFLPFYAVAFASYLPGAFTRISLGRDVRRVWRRHPVPIYSVLALATLFFTFRSLPPEPWRLQVAGHALPQQGKHLIYPVGAVDYLAKNHFHGNVMVPYDWGSYVMWKLGPDVKVSFDSRYEVAYPQWREAEDDCFYEARDGWQTILEKYPTDLVLVRSDFSVAKHLGEYNGWHVVYRDPQFVIFGRPELNLPVRESDSAAPNGVFP